MSDEKNNKVSNIIGYVLALLIVGVVGFFIYNNFIKIDKNNNNNTQVLNDKNKLEEYSTTKFYFLNNKLSINSSEPIFFKDSKIDYKTLSDEDKLLIAYSMLSADDRNQSGTSSKDECFINNGKYTYDNYPSDCLSESFSKELLLEQLKNVFEGNIKLNYINFRPSGNQECIIEDSVYKCYLNKSNTNISKLQFYTAYDSSELNGDELIVYSYLLTMKSESSFSKEEAGIYNDSKGINKIDNLSYFDSITHNGVTVDATNKLINHYKNKALKYKSIFINENGNYKWISTEPVK